MAKELPYFRFTPSEWQNGNISLEEYQLQGFYIQVCCYYWVNDCSISLAMLKKRFRNDIELIKQLQENDFLSCKNDDDYVSINFLNEQFDTLSESRKKRQQAGSKGGVMRSSNAKAMLKQCSSYKDKDKDKEKDKDNIKETCFSFSDFWNAYPTKTGKVEAEKKYNKLAEQDRMLIKNSIIDFVNNKPFKEYNHPMASTYINQKRWLDAKEESNTIIQQIPITGALSIQL